MSTLKELSVITITYNNEDELQKTYKSLEDFRSEGGKHIIVNGGKSVSGFVKNVLLIEESDQGIYDAINKGISKVSTTYFMLIHSGDFLIETTKSLEILLKKLNDESLDILLNDCSIEYGNEKRYLKSSKWMPWMFKFGAQPPHPPTIYRTQSVSLLRYDLNHPVIADFKYLEDLFRVGVKWARGNLLLIHMSAGGATSSGVRSFFHVNKQFRKLKGPLIMAWFALTRPAIKVYQML